MPNPSPIWHLCLHLTLGTKKKGYDAYIKTQNITFIFGGKWFWTEESHMSFFTQLIWL